MQRHPTFIPVTPSLPSPPGSPLSPFENDEKKSVTSYELTWTLTATKNCVYLKQVFVIVFPERRYCIVRLLLMLRIRNDWKSWKHHLWSLNSSFASGATTANTSLKKITK